MHFCSRVNRKPIVRDLLTTTFLKHVCRFANVLKKNGVKKGDRIVLYLPMIWQLPVVMLACARIGAVHTVVFGGFSRGSISRPYVSMWC